MRRHPAKIKSVTTALRWETSLMVPRDSCFTLTVFGLCDVLGTFGFCDVVVTLSSSGWSDLGFTRMTRGLLMVNALSPLLWEGCIIAFWRFKIRNNIHPHDAIMKKRPRNRRRPHVRKMICAPKSKNSCGMVQIVIAWSRRKTVKGTNTIVNEQPHVARTIIQNRNTLLVRSDE